MGWNTRPRYLPAPCDHDPVIAAGPAGYDVILPNLAVNQPVLDVAFEPGPALGRGFTLGSARLGRRPVRTTRAYIGDSGLVAGTLGELGQVEYLPDYIPDSTIGDFVIGESAPGFRHHTHKAVVPGATPADAEIEAP